MPLTYKKDMAEKLFFTKKERNDIVNIIRGLRENAHGMLKREDEKNVFRHLKTALENDLIQRDVFGMNPILLSLQTAQIAVSEIGLKRDGVMAILLYTSVAENDNSLEEIEKNFGKKRIYHNSRTQKHTGTV